MAERLIHVRTQEVMADRIAWAIRWDQRARGLIGNRPLQNGGALVIARGRQVHTFGVASEIDVIFCDEHWDVLKVISPMPRRRVTRWVAGTRWTVELPAGRATSVRIGDALRIES